MLDIRSYILSRFPDSTPNATGRIHAKCPFHDDRSPSFSIDVERGLFICGSPKCGVRGNFALFYKMSEGLVSWRDVYERLRDKKVVGDLQKLLEPEKAKDPVFRIQDFPVYPFIEPIQTIPYLQQRGVGEDVINLFGLCYGRTGWFSGLNIENSLVMPVFDLDGTYRTFQVRYLGHPKLRWKNPQGSPVQDLLYGGWLVQPSRYLWIVEGASDVWRLFQAGIQAVGVFTKEASAAQLNRIHMLASYLDMSPVVCLDGDVSSDSLGGRDFAATIASELSAYGYDPKIIRLNPDEDPGSLTNDRLSEIQQQLGEGTHEGGTQ